MTAEGPRYDAGAMPSPGRDYTPRYFDPQSGELSIDFVLHGDGVASSWAAQAQPGDDLKIGGPRGSFLVADDYDHYVLLGDETALPAIGRWLEAMPADMHAEVYIEIADAAERQELLSAADADIYWLERKRLRRCDEHAAGRQPARLRAARRRHVLLDRRRIDARAGNAQVPGRAPASGQGVGACEGVLEGESAGE